MPVYEVGEHEGQNYFSMKLVDGGNLAEELPAFQANPRAAAILMAETAEARDDDIKSFYRVIEDALKELRIRRELANEENDV